MLYQRIRNLHFTPFKILLKDIDKYMPSILLYCHTKEQIQEIKALIPDNLVPASKASLLQEASARFEKNSAQLFMKCIFSDIDEVRFDVVPELKGLKH